MEFLIQWFVDFLLIISCMVVDNLFWISDSPEYPQVKKMNIKELIDYVFYKRIIPVWTSWRDITPAIITSLILTWIIS